MASRRLTIQSTRLLSIQNQKLLNLADYPTVITKPDLTSWDWYWKFDEGSGTTISNSGALSGLGAGLVNLSGGLPLWETDASLGGSCLNFGDGASYNQVRSTSAYPANFRPTTNMSLVIACKLRSLGGSGLYYHLISMGDYVSGSDRNGWYMMVNYHTNSAFSNITCNGGSTQNSYDITHATAGVAIDTSYLLGLTKSGPTIKMFVNGAQVGTTGSSAVTIGYRANEYLCVGHSSDPSVWANSAYGLEGRVGFVAGIASAVSDATMLSIAQEAGFA